MNTFRKQLKSFDLPTTIDYNKQLIVWKFVYLNVMERCFIIDFMRFPIQLNITAQFRNIDYQY